MTLLRLLNPLVANPTPPRLRTARALESLVLAQAVRPTCTPSRPLAERAASPEHAAYLLDPSRKNLRAWRKASERRLAVVRQAAR